MNDKQDVQCGTGNTVVFGTKTVEFVGMDSVAEQQRQVLYMKISDTLLVIDQSSSISTIKTAMHIKLLCLEASQTALWWRQEILQLWIPNLQVLQIQTGIMSCLSANNPHSGFIKKQMMISGEK